ncbi:hypothetical protein MTO96_023931 [Rhipicephalus appendiculatus]
MVKDGGEFIITLEITVSNFVKHFEIRVPAEKEFIHRDLEKDDGGPYKCNIRNEDGEINANLNLNIAGAAAPTGVAPSFVEKPQITAEEEGKLIIMECKLELRDPEFSDAGIYKCNVKNEAGESNANLTLNIELAPVIKERPKVVRRELHKTIVIECHVQSTNKPEVVWFKENTQVREDTRHQVHIRQLVAKNVKGEAASQTVAVDLEEEKKEPEKKEPEKKEEPKPKGEKPKIVQMLASQTVEEGKTCEFVCRVESVTKVTVVWMKNKRVVRETTTTRITFDGSTAKLVFSPASKDMAGNYTVEFTNEFGKEESSAELIVTAEVKKVEEKKVEAKKPAEKKAAEKKPDELKPETIERKPSIDKPSKLEADKKALPERRTSLDRQQNGEVTESMKDEIIREPSPVEERRPSISKRRPSDKIEPLQK